jgi:hypothetical protein
LSDGYPDSPRAKVRVGRWRRRAPSVPAPGLPRACRLDRVAQTQGQPDGGARLPSLVLRLLIQPGGVNDREEGPLTPLVVLLSALTNIWELRPRFFTWGPGTFHGPNSARRRPHRQAVARNFTAHRRLCWAGPHSLPRMPIGTNRARDDP